MIRPYLNTDCDALLDIWLSASLQAHDFVPEAFWRDQLGAMREHYLPLAETRVLEQGGAPLAFASVHEGRLAALFVSPEQQGCGLGLQLLEAVMAERTRLELDVYQANRRATAFYRRAGFKVIAQGHDPHTGQAQLTMAWSRP